MSRKTRILLSALFTIWVFICIAFMAGIVGAGYENLESPPSEWWTRPITNEVMR